MDQAHHRFVSFNCKNLKRSFEGIKKLCKSANIVALQETWLLPFDLPMLDTVDSDFVATGTSAVDVGKGVLRGRPFGGVALLWRKSAFRSVKVIDCNNVRITAVKITFESKSILIFSIYMPTNDIINLPEFTNCLSRISSIIDDHRDIETVYM